MNMFDIAPGETELERGGYVKGVAVALVTQNKDPEGQHRVRVKFPWHDNSQESYWARIAVPMAGKDRGMAFLPEVGDEVLVAFEREDIRFPFVVGSLWNGVDQPPEANSDGKNDKRVIKSRKGHRLLFDDGAKGLIQLELQDKKKVSIDDDGIRVDDAKGNSISIQSASGAIAIEAKGALTLKGTTISIEASGSLQLKSSATLSIRGSLVNIN